MLFFSLVSWFIDCLVSAKEREKIKKHMFEMNDIAFVFMCMLLAYTCVYGGDANELTVNLIELTILC